MLRIGIVGAGVAAAATAFSLSNRDAEVAITVLEKSRGVGGRAATRRRDGVVYDYGANYVKPDDRVTRVLSETLDAAGLVAIDEPVWTFDASGSIAPGRASDEQKLTYRGGVTQLAKRLFDRADADVHRETRVERVVHESGAENAEDGPGGHGDGDDDDDGDGDGPWHLRDADGRSWGPFDVVCLNPPAPQTAALLRASRWPDPRRHDLVAAADAVPYRSVWTGVFHYPFELDVPYYALVNVDKDHDIGWIAREECKPGHVPQGESLLVVQANHEWSVARDGEAPDATLDALAATTARLLEDDRLTDPDWTDHQRWRYALPERGVDAAVVERAEDAGLYCVGDWVAGEGRLRAAVRNGLDAGDRIVTHS